MSDLNDPRVFFAAERTLLAWNRTSLSLMAFGFVIERFGLFVSILMPQHDMPLQRVITNLVVAALGIVLAVYFFHSV